MKDLVAQFRNLNPKEPGSWPPLPKAVGLLGLFIVILVAACAPKAAASLIFAAAANSARSLKASSLAVAATLVSMRRDS